MFEDVSFLWIAELILYNHCSWELLHICAACSRPTSVACEQVFQSRTTGQHSTIPLHFFKFCLRNTIFDVIHRHLLIVTALTGNFRSSFITLELIIGLSHFFYSSICANGSFTFSSTSSGFTLRAQLLGKLYFWGFILLLYNCSGLGQFKMLTKPQAWTFKQEKWSFGFFNRISLCTKLLATIGVLQWPL